MSRKSLSTSPRLFFLAGPNGAGKTTSAEKLLPREIPFINADEIAKTLAQFEGTTLDIKASRLLLEKINSFENELKSFAIETNLANKGLLSRIKRLQNKGYTVTLIFLWLQSVDLAIDRVMERVRRGGHSVPAEVIKRRYKAGLENFFTHYQSEVDSWAFFDNSAGEVKMIACAEKDTPEIVIDTERWNAILRRTGNNGKA
ncbi:MAG: zeta toxin family protein [Candidatus Riflebacteria bacterium]|nr:zeta toxin family protein [Candidatus Riflebacteria bacterium]